MKLIEDVGFDFSTLRLQRAPRHPGGGPGRRHPGRGEETAPAILQQRINQQGFENSRRMVGTTQRILVSDYSKKDPGMLQAAPSTIASSTSAATTRD